MYIFWFLHQTTTLISCRKLLIGCISFDSYIKPQLALYHLYLKNVVYLLIPTSNHNFNNLQILSTLVVYLLIPTSNHNARFFAYVKCPLYIFWFLHQTTTITVGEDNPYGCISFDSYIKPQRGLCSYYWNWCCISFDSYIKPQPVHFTTRQGQCCISFDSYIKPQLLTKKVALFVVVYLLIPTSNHNPLQIWRRFSSVVYLLIPTSNHNQFAAKLVILRLYIFWFLHQTTTFSGAFNSRRRLYIFWFLHQTTT